MKNKNEQITSRSRIFQSNDAAIAFLEGLGLLDGQKSCPVCGSKMFLEKADNYTCGFRLRCVVESCRRSKTLFQNLEICSPKVNVHDYLFIIFLWLEKNFQFNILKNSNVSLSSIKRIKRKILQLITNDNEKHCILIGKDNPIQVDESVIIKGKLIKSPSKMYDSKKNATWIVGAVEEKTRKLVLKIVLNRKK